MPPRSDSKVIWLPSGLKLGAVSIDGAFVNCVNPLVAFDASSAPRPPHGYPPDQHDLTHGGLPTVLSQTFRSLIQSRMQAGMKGYKQRYPHADVLLFEPDRGDSDLFFQNVFRYADRRRLAEHAYQCTRRDLLREAPRLQKLLQRHGITLRVERSVQVFGGGAPQPPKISQR